MQSKSAQGHKVSRQSWVIGAVGSALLALSAAAAGAGPYVVSTTIPSVSGIRLGIDSTNHTIWVVNQANNAVYTIDGTTNTENTSAINVGSAPDAIGVNSTTHLAYVADIGENTLAVVDGVSHSVTGTVPIGGGHREVAVDELNLISYVSNSSDGTVSAINLLTNTVTATIPTGPSPIAVAVDSSTHIVYAADYVNNIVSVINSATNMVTATVPVGINPRWMAANPSTHKVYVVNQNANSVSVIDGAANKLITTIAVGNVPYGVAVDPSSNTVFVANEGDGTVSVIDGASNTVIETLPVGSGSGGDANDVVVDTSTHNIYVMNSNSSSISVIAAPPVVQCGAASNQWLAANTSITCTASDATVGLADPTQASVTLSTNVAAGTETANASTNSVQICNTLGGCAKAGPVAGNKIDRKPPVITLTTPKNGASYGAVVNLLFPVKVSYSCSDGGSGVASCTGTLPNGATLNTGLGALGTHTFVVNAIDNVGNRSSVSATYTVTLVGLLPGL